MGAAAEHTLVSFGGAFEREDFVHRADAGEDAEGESVFGVDGGARIPALDGAASLEKEAGGDGEGGGGADDDEGAIDGEAALDGAHGIAAGDRGEDDFCAAQFEQAGDRVLGLAVEIMMGAELGGEGALVVSAGDGDSEEAELGGELNGEMAEASDAEDGDDIARPGAAVAERVEGGDAGAHEGSGIDGRQFIGEQSGCGGWGDHVIGIAAVEGDTGDLVGFAGEEIAAAAGLAASTIAAVPADADALADGPGRGIGADGVDEADDFVSGNARILNPGEEAVLGEDVAVADAARLDFDADLAGARLRDIPLDEFERTLGGGDLNGAHFGHFATIVTM